MAHDSKGQRLLDEIQSIVRQLDFDPQRAQAIFDCFTDQLKRGLEEDSPSQIPSYVTSLPSGSETGLVLAVDLGGTNCRVCSVELHGNSNYTVRKSQQSVPRNLRINSSYRPLFKFIAFQIKDFLDVHHSKELRPTRQDGNGYASPERQIWKLGFVFSFTYIQTSLTQGKMVCWDKDWDIPEAIGRDPCVMLQQAIDDLDLPVVVTALANDSVGTLVTRAYRGAISRGGTIVGAIFGTGTNAAYVERIEKIKKLNLQGISKNKQLSGFMLVNTEWGNFDKELKILPQVSYDSLLDQESTHPGEQALEKRVAGLYLAELLRLIVLSLCSRQFFSITLQEDSPVLQREGLDSAFLSQIASTPDHRLREFLSLQLKADHMSDSEASAIKLLGAVIVRRSARLAGIALGATISMSSSSISTAAENKLQSPFIGKRQPRARTNSNASHFASFPRRVFRFFRRYVCPLDKWRRFMASRSFPSKSISFQGSESSVTNKQVIDVGVDGSLIRYYPKYEAQMREALRSVTKIGPKTEEKIRISFVEDGSAVGAALMALSSSLVDKSIPR